MNIKKHLLNQEILRSINEEHPHTDNYLIPKEIGRKVRSLMSIKWDLEDSRAALEELSVMILMHTGDEVVRTALWKSAIITYGRCFTDSEDGGQSKLEIKDCFKNVKYFIPMHTSLINVRNGYIAHRGNNEFEETVLFMKVDRKEPEAVTYAMKSFRAATSSFENLVSYQNVIEHLQAYVEQRIQKQLHKIDGFIHKGDPENGEAESK